MKQNLGCSQKWNVLKTSVFCMWCDFQPQAFFIHLLKYRNYHHRLQSHSTRDSEIRHPQSWMAQICSLSQPVWERIKPWCPTGVVLKLECAAESPGGLRRHRLLGPRPRVSDRVSPGWGPRICKATSSQMLVLLRENHFTKASTVCNELTSLFCIWNDTSYGPSWGE